MDNENRKSEDFFSVEAILQSLFEEISSVPIPEPAVDLNPILTLIQEAATLGTDRFERLETVETNSAAFGIREENEASAVGLERIVGLLGEIRALIAERDPEYL